MPRLKKLAEFLGWRFWCGYMLCFCLLAPIVLIEASRAGACS